MTTSSIRIALVENDKLSSEQVSKALERDDDLCLVGVFTSAESFLKKHLEMKLDVVIVNIGLPGINGMDCIAQAKAERPRTQFLIHTHLENPAYIFQALQAGASGYLLKHPGEQRMRQAVREVHTGGSPMTSTIARMVVNSFQSSVKLAIQDHFLTEREKGVMDQLANGFMYKEIAVKSEISTETVRKHVRNIYCKLQVSSRMEAIRKVYPGR